MKYRCFLLLLIAGVAAHAQNYQAIHGSSYAGSLGVGNNPASIVNTPFSWDVDVFSLQEKHFTNAVKVYDYSLLSSPAKSKWNINSGSFSRKGDLNYNVNLLNTRIALNRRQAIAFGVNLRGYARANTSSFNFIDTMTTVEEFFVANGALHAAQADFTGSSWIELFGTYGQTLWDHQNDRLNAAVTLKVSRGTGGAYARIRQGEIEQQRQGNKINYVLKTASAQYGYSTNFDTWNQQRSNAENIKDFITRSEGGISLDLGLEYLIKDDGTRTIFDDDDYYDYNWKIGVSLMDLGFNQYKYGTQSRTLTGIRAGIDATTLNNRFLDIQNLQGFNDSVATIVNSANRLNGTFKVFNPARLIINVDRYITDAFYVDGELTANLSPLAGDQHFYARELNFITVTPRWETRRWGVYMPFQYNALHRFMLGAAFKAGPLLLGFHNLGNIFSNKKMQNGGGYIALVIRSGNWLSAKGDKRNDCPPGR